MKIIYELNGTLTNREIEDLRSAVGWDNRIGSFQEVRKGLFAHITARHEGALVGFIDILSDGIADSYLQDLMVLPQFRGNGIGTELVVRAIRHMQSVDIKCIQVTFQDSLLSFYEKFGFHVHSAGIIDRDTMDTRL